MLKLKAAISPVEKGGVATRPSAPDRRDNHEPAVSIEPIIDGVEGNDGFDPNGLERFFAENVSAGHPGSTASILEHARVLLRAGSPEAAAEVLTRAIQDTPSDPDIWFLLAIARADLGQAADADLAIREAARLEPDHPQVEAVRAAIQARATAGWEVGLRCLVELQAAEPENDELRNMLARAYLFLANRDWTEVREVNGRLVAISGKRMTVVAPDVDLDPGFYATTALHVKTAAECLERLGSLNAPDPEVSLQLGELESAVTASRKRHFDALWGEVLYAVVMIGYFFMLLQQNGLLALAALAMGGGMLVACFKPQYRVNHLILMKGGRNLIDSLGEMSRANKYTAIAFGLLALGLSPILAVYKLYRNWIEEMLASPGIAQISPAPPPPDVEVSPDELPPTLARITNDEPDDAPADPAGVTNLPSRESAPAPIVDKTMDGQGAAEVWNGPLSGGTELEDTHAQSAEGAAPEAIAAKASGPTLAQRLVLWRSNILGRFPSFKSLVLGKVAVTVLAVAGVVVLAGSIAAFVWLGTRNSPPPAPVGPDVIADASPVVAAQPLPLPASVSGEPVVLTTGLLEVQGQRIVLFGVTGVDGVSAQKMESFIEEQGGAVTCEPVRDAAYRCWTSRDGRKGYDVAAAAVVNGAARVPADGPPDYLEMQATAQAARRGIWQ